MDMNSLDIFDFGQVTIPDPDVWSAVSFPGSVDDENVSGVKLEFTYASGSLSNVPMVRDILVTGCIPIEGKPGTARLPTNRLLTLIYMVHFVHHVKNNNVKNNT